MTIQPIGNMTMPGMTTLSMAGTENGDPWEEFSVLLGNQIKETDRMEKRAKDLSERALLGNAGVSIHEAQIASSEAELHMRLLLQVRNKGLEVYREVMSMPV
ncbi:MAG: flagellar hook-basal body complex protein FliE [Magnetococcales bacterium]|nr:flagellar hook-basal body complex protein FliE [Magnetococcales bacterium]MBF0149899.1 flagellar hook-basal body complex protein FliE [Magnetococcales bacterium]MBF0346554.1 flagellar hook-basal body complex protein FliE [Magnetococcales bacterium]MBF0632018.1 flagellar hook-basal body complex protein FliE [Magnetococcales bacterium]